MVQNFLLLSILVTTGVLLPTLAAYSTRGLLVAWLWKCT